MLPRTHTPGPRPGSGQGLRSRPKAKLQQRVAQRQDARDPTPGALKTQPWGARGKAEQLGRSQPAVCSADCLAGDSILVGSAIHIAHRDAKNDAGRNHRETLLTLYCQPLCLLPARYLVVNLLRSSIAWPRESRDAKCIKKQPLSPLGSLRTLRLVFLAFRDLQAVDSAPAPIIRRGAARRQVLHHISAKLYLAGAQPASAHEKKSKAKKRKKKDKKKKKEVKHADKKKYHRYTTF